MRLKGCRAKADVESGPAPRLSAAEVSPENAPARVPGRDQVSSWQFALWFRQSEVVDGKGRPKPVYHRTAAGFQVFDIERGDLGSHFGSQAQASGLLAGNSRPGERTMPVYLSIQKAIRLSDKGGFHADAVAPQLRRMGLLDAKTAARLAAVGDRGTVAERRAANKEIREILLREGFDGVVYRNAQEGPGDSWIVFDSRQVKSATANDGNFDPENPDICS